MTMDDFLECQAVDTFINGLHGDELQWAIRLSWLRTLTDRQTDTITGVWCHQLSFEKPCPYRVSSGWSNQRNWSSVEVTVWQAVKEESGMLQWVMEETLAMKRKPCYWNCRKTGHIWCQCSKSLSAPSKYYEWLVLDCHVPEVTIQLASLHHTPDSLYIEVQLQKRSIWCCWIPQPLRRLWDLTLAERRSCYQRSTYVWLPEYVQQYMLKLNGYWYWL